MAEPCNLSSPRKRGPIFQYPWLWVLTRAGTTALGLALLFAVPRPASAQSSQDFYKNKQVRMIIGHAVGNDYDVGARVLAKHLPKHIPGQPSIIVQNMPQAASIVAANYRLYAGAARR